MIWRLIAFLSRLFEPKHKPVYYCVVSAGHGLYVGMAKLAPFTSSEPNPILEPGPIWFANGHTRERAFCNITEEMVRLGIEKNVSLCKPFGKE